MKKLLTIFLILLPLTLTGQKVQNSKKISIEKFFKTYSDLPYYSSVEVTEEMFKLFDNLKDADEKMVTFLKKLKYVRMLESNDKEVKLSAKSVKVNPGFVYNNAMSQLDLSRFSRLMKSNQDGEKMAFYKKTYSTKDHEFLLIHS
ncbi:MAG: DUF4252 domain-containing protein, partial [Bacteroidales bacterium]|nr:DUF4252 domain-containing protein [Bacteroidales bacterium]